MTDAANSGVTITAVKGCLVATLHANLHESVFDAIRDTTLARVSSSNATAVIFDLSAVRLLDCFEFENLRKLAEMLSLLGCRTMLVGLTAGVVAYLVDHGASTKGIEVELGLEDALDRLVQGQLAG